MLKFESLDMSIAKTTFEVKWNTFFLASKVFSFRLKKEWKYNGQSLNPWPIVF